MQVYKELRILTARPDKLTEKTIDHKLYGYISGINRCSAFMWCKNALVEISNTLKNGQIPILVGGSGLYIKSLIDGRSNIPITSEKIRIEAEQILDNEGIDKFYARLKSINSNIVHNISMNDHQRLIRSYSVWLQTGKTLYEWNNNDKKSNKITNKFLNIKLSPDRELLRKNIYNRFFKMIEKGALQEVMALEDFDKSLPIMKAHGARELLSVNRNEISLDKAAEITINHTNQYAKRQETWFKHQFNYDCEIIDFNEDIDKYCSNILSLYNKLY
jgi:tRNA dimethylallyltransferase